MTGPTPDYVAAAARASTDASTKSRAASPLDSALIGLQQPIGGVRPIALGAVWYRPAGAYALAELGNIVPILAPQLGVGMSGGMDAAAHGLRSALVADERAMLMSLEADVRAAKTCPAASRCSTRWLRIYRRFCHFCAERMARPRTCISMAPRALEGTAPAKSQAGEQQGDAASMMCLLTVYTAAATALDTVVVAMADDVSLCRWGW